MICHASSPIGRLNAFQRVMLQWSELHPYNAVHTYRLSGPLCLQSLQQAIQNPSGTTASELPRLIPMAYGIATNRTTRSIQPKSSWLPATSRPKIV